MSGMAGLVRVGDLPGFARAVAEASTLWSHCDHLDFPGTADAMLPIPRSIASASLVYDVALTLQKFRYESRPGRRRLRLVEGGAR